MSGLSPYQWKLIEARIKDFCIDNKIRLRFISDRQQQEQEKNLEEPKLQVTEFDSMRLKTLLTTATMPGSSRQTHLAKLRQILENAEIVPPEKIPADVVTMNSTVRLKDCRSDTEMVLSLLFPSDADIDTNLEHMKVSILTPIGVSVFGRRVGETLEGGMKVDELLYQPEAAGNFDL